MDDYHGEKLKVGDLVTVQVVRDKIKTKRYAVTTDISLQGDYAVTTLLHLSEFLPRLQIVQEKRN